MRSSPTIVDGRLFYGATFNFTLYVLESTTATPVHLSGFTAQTQDRAVALRWHTSFEHTHDGFHVYRSEQLDATRQGWSEGRRRSDAPIETQRSRPAGAKPAQPKLSPAGW